MSCGTLSFLRLILKMNLNFLSLQFIHNTPCENKKNLNRIVPFADTKIFSVPILNWRKLTDGEDVKRVYNVTFGLNAEVNYDFSPGDTIGIIPENDDLEVEKLIIRLNLEKVADLVCQIKVSENTTKKNATVPKHLLQDVSLREIFRKYVDIRSPPKKTFLKSLLNFTSNSDEITKLNSLISPKESQKYFDFITGSGRTLLCLLESFPLCQPPIATILEHLPPLQPRAFSISSSPEDKTALDITFSVVDNGHKGLCTGWLENILNRSLMEVPIYFRSLHNFKLVENVPLLLIATGTGIAPFRSFLLHRKYQIKNGATLKEAWLIYGCRYERDCLYKQEIEDFLKTGTLTSAKICFSRENKQKYYVQNYLNETGENVTNFIMKGAFVYICGDAKTMVKGVKNALLGNFVKFAKEEGGNYLSDLEQNGRLLMDSWT